MSKLLSGVRAEGSVVTHAVMPAPWTIRFADHAPLTMITVLRGGGTLLAADGGRWPLKAGDTALVRGPETFHIVSTDADGPASTVVPTEYEIACFLEDSECTAEELSGINWGTAENATALMVGAYRTTSARRHERLLHSLPKVLVVTDDFETCGWVETATRAAVGQSAGSQAMMDRLLDWSLVCTLRTWFEHVGSAAPGWFRGLSDPIVGPALNAIDTTPGAPWTVASLAAESGVSRSLFAKRFTAVMGEPPLAYLTETRMREAEELLTATEHTIAHIARSVGYADPFGFSAAFKRHRGVSPTAFRASASDLSGVAEPGGPDREVVALGMAGGSAGGS